MANANQKPKSGGYPRSIVSIGGQYYIADHRRRELWGVSQAFEPRERIAFDSPRGKELLRQTITLPCKLCGAPQLLSRDSPRSDVICYHCADEVP